MPRDRISRIYSCSEIHAKQYFFFFFLNDTAPPEISTLSLPAALPIFIGRLCHHPPVARLDRTLPIAVFDSGVGGLTVLHECLVWLPHEDFVYLGDTARFPYGGRDRKSTRLNSSHLVISYAVFCLKKKK